MMLMGQTGQKTVRTAAFIAGIIAAALLPAGDAAACGGCFTTVSGMAGAATQVSGHRMILAIRPESTSLWDQIEYAGEPESFAWVLPIKGTVEVGLSSDALFQVLEQQTRVTVTVKYDCDYQCSGAGGSGGGSGDGVGFPGSAGDDGGPVTILNQGVVGPYETVQLSSADPMAITDWLSSHGYDLPADIQPIVDAYVQDGFGFLALKLVPGQGVQSMRPVRVTFPGASPVLPLRMVAAGTGDITPVKLWVASGGRYQPQNAPSFLLDQTELSWSFYAGESNYATVAHQQLAASKGLGWLIQGSLLLAGPTVGEPIATDPAALESYADETGQNQQANLDADMTALFGADYQHQNQYFTRMFAELSREALANDLVLEASSDQNDVPLDYTTEVYDGEPPCPTEAEVCGLGNGGNGGAGAGNGLGGNGDGGSEQPGCACATQGDAPEWPAAAFATAFLATLTLRRRKKTLLRR